MTETGDDRGDRALLADLAAGNPQALGQLYGRHAASLLRHALALSRRRPEAEDLVHTVFVKAAAIGAPLLGVRKPASYLHRMLHTAWLDGRRRTITGERIERQSAGEGVVTDAGAGSIDLWRALDRLPSEQREVVVLHVVEGFSFREIGSMTGASLFTAAARYRLAIAKLQRALQPKAEEEGA